MLNINPRSSCMGKIKPEDDMTGCYLITLEGEFVQEFSSIGPRLAKGTDLVSFLHYLHYGIRNDEAIEVPLKGRLA